MTDPIASPILAEQHFRSHFSTVLKSALIIALRLLGLFMVIPMLSLHAKQLSGGNGHLVGLAVGIYGLSQACLQIPFGRLSDKFGRKQLVGIGLGIFILGSLLCALSQSIYLLILGRFFQGAGAIGGVMIAFIADLTPAYHLAKAMAVVGISIALSFILAFVLGFLMYPYYGISGLFYISALLGGLALLILFQMLPQPNQRFHTPQDKTKKLSEIMRDRRLWPLNVSICLQHCLFTSTFVVLPILLKRQLALTETTQWKLYLITLVVSFLIALATIRQAEYHQRFKPFIQFAIGLSFLGQCLLFFFPQNLGIITLALMAYFVGFNQLEAALPACVAKQATRADRGATMGVYSSAQFLGIFLGGSLGGLFFQFHLLETMFLFNSVLLLGWLLLAKGFVIKKA